MVYPFGNTLEEEEDIWFIQRKDRECRIVVVPQKNSEGWSTVVDDEQQTITTLIIHYSTTVDNIYMAEYGIVYARAQTIGQEFKWKEKKEKKKKQMEMAMLLSFVCYY